ncbi:MAG: cyclase family protein [Aggregatilineales bacterium]
MASSQLIDLSHTVEDGVVTYKGMPAPIICDYLSREDSRSHYAEGTEFHIGKIEMVANTGTYIDSPFHRYADGKDLSQLDLEQLAHLDGVLIDATNISGRAIDESYFNELDVRGKAIIVRTGWSQHWKTDHYFEGHPFLTEGVATLLRDRGATLVGIDSLNIDNTDEGTRPVHTVLLGADILIVEHMTNLAHIPANTPFKFYAVPVKVKDFGTFPVRAFALVE